MEIGKEDEVDEEDEDEVDDVDEDEDDAAIVASRLRAGELGWLEASPLPPLA